jgi:hypothetical protein
MKPRAESGALETNFQRQGYYKHSPTLRQSRDLRLAPISADFSQKCRPRTSVQHRLKIWRRHAVQRLICETDGLTEDVGCGVE